jgi:HlyD family secretion protein
VRVGSKKTVETAPFAGRVLQWLVQPGQNVMPGTPLLLFGGQQLELRVPVAERDIAKGVVVGGPALVSLGEQKLRLVVADVAPMATGPGRSVVVRIPVPEDVQASFGHGNSARVELVIAELSNALSVPEKALWLSGSLSSVFVIDAGQTHQVPVQTGIRDHGWIAVEGNLSVGARVAVSNLDVLKDGTQIFAVNDDRSSGVQP